MLRQVIRIGFGLGLLAAVLLGHGAAHAGVVLVQAAPLVIEPRIQATPSATPNADDATPTREALMSRLLTFVLDDYLGNARLNHENQATMYADVISYYGKSQTSRMAVMADKRAYYRRWPSRTYTYQPDSLKLAEVGSDGIGISFRHTYEVAKGPERRRGTAVTRLDVALRDGRFMILSEDGEVVRR